MHQMKKTVCPCCNESLHIIADADDCIELTLATESLSEPSKEALEALRIEFG